MGDIVTRGLQQDATYWAPGAPNKFGKIAFSTPITIKCRWEDKAELFMAKTGKETVSRAKVMLASDVSTEGYLHLGISTDADPRTLNTAYEIMAFGKTPNRKATKFARRAFL